MKIPSTVIPLVDGSRLARTRGKARESDRVDVPAPVDEPLRADQDALSVALDLGDDATALLTVLRQRRRDRASGEVESDAPSEWTDALLEDDSLQRFEELHACLRGGGSAQQVLALLRTRFPDAGDALLVLGQWRRFRDLSREERECLEEVLATLRAALEGEGAQSLRDARAGANASAKAKLVAHRTGLDAKALRESYRDFLGMDLVPISQYELWMEQYGFEARHSVLDFIERALVADIYALDPSCSRLEFGNALRYIVRLGSLRSADLRLLSSGWRQDIMARLRVDKPTWLLAMFSVVRDAEKLRTLLHATCAKAVPPPTIEERCILVQSMRRALSQLSPAMWHGQDEYAATFAALDELAEQAVSAEIAARPLSVLRVR
ncbi:MULTISPECIES: type III secretion system gatekeeper subunit SctW [Dyella]|uniref:YopN family type III secretion system gatekeeper subunit n=2 Tax=Dyella TaxID=231454 RepID=A0A4R0YW45_9GAMM|nr:MULTISPECIES: type III secretion system gatekeeper subunit SctW [Dyella]TBR38724.1 YopN family type III secretion system gatekeeper subunit [Dyella terrae]TCI13685.1 YopN family type III secretion system gatekeeper subunit [Dyella soli]